MSHAERQREPTRVLRDEGGEDMADNKHVEHYEFVPARLDATKKFLI